MVRVLKSAFDSNKRGSLGEFQSLCIISWLLNYPELFTGSGPRTCRNKLQQ